MPACVPVNNNNVGDVSSDVKPADQSDSKFSKIISCLFLRKKTDVVDMTKESSSVAKKQKMSVDRSERSRRVLKMESMRTAPMSRDEADTKPTATQGQNQMFLPSESPTASFLSYLNPSVRRACSEVIRTNSTPSSNKQPREAFTETRLTVRNTNYRGNQASENVSKKGNDKTADGKPPKPPDRTRSMPKETRKPIIVPGIASASDDDIGYDSDTEISDLHDEMRRMNLSQPDLRTSLTKPRRREGGASEGQLTDEGSISLSEGSDTDAEEAEKVDEGDRPQNPSPSDKRDKTGSEVTKKQSMEDAIDNLYQQTQQNIDTIYKNGLENMDLETYRSDTMTPDTYMKRLEEDLLKSQPDDQAVEEPQQKKNEAAINEESNQNLHGNKNQVTNDNNQHLDSLLNEVSIWAQDRQRWLLDGEGPDKEPNTRESSSVTMTTDSRAIEQVTKSNKDKRNEWVNDRSVSDVSSKVTSDTKASGILTGPKLFRSSSRTPIQQRGNFVEINKGAVETQLSPNTSDNNIKIVDLARDTESETVLPDLDFHETYPEPWTSDMYTSTPRGDKLERSTINDNLSELNDTYQFRARSPDSWLSSAGSCSHLVNKTCTSISEANDGFEMSPTPSKEPETPVKVVTASNIGKSHQIMRIAPKVHTPFKGLDRQITPMPVEPNPIPTKPMLRNTQLKPISVLRAANQKSTIESFPSLPGRKSFGSYRAVGDVNENGHLLENQMLRPFSEIPLRTDVSDKDRNHSLLMHSSSVRDARDLQTSVAQTSLRPVSETIQTKRTDKIGFGPIMATKENQMYARDVINAMEKHRLQPQHDAFHENSSASANEPLIEYDDDDDNKEKEVGRKRHKVFTNNLIRGGYSYDKHSRTRPTENQHSFKSEGGEKVKYSLSIGSTNNNPATRSINDLSLTIRDSVDNVQSPRYNQTHSTPYEQTSLVNGNAQNNPASKRGNVSQSFTMGDTQGAQRKHANLNNVTQSFHNKNTATQSHGLGVSPRHGLVLAGTSPNISANQTANKFRQIRSRRDQEMDWLMRDAAETEV